MVKVKLLDIDKKKTKFDKKNKVFQNGEDNAYPERTDRLINNSVTAKMASLIMIQYLLGKGFGKDIDAKIINKDEDLSVSDFANDVSCEITNHRGVFIHVGYDATTLLPINPRVLPFDWCRLGKKDDNLYSGKIKVKTDWTSSKEKAVSVNVFNPKKSVVKAQIKEAGGIKKYKGQIFYYNMDRKFYYPLSRIDSVMNDCDSEAQSSIYKNTLLRNGFFGKMLIVTRPLVDKKIKQYIYEGEGSDKKKVTNPAYITDRSEAKEAKQKLEEFVGAHQAGGAMHVQMDNGGDELEKSIMFKKIESEIEPDLFQNVESSVRDNILVAFNNLPIGLVKASDGLFSNSAESIVEMKKTFWQNTVVDRSIMEHIVSKFYNYVFAERLELKSSPIIEDTPLTESQNETKLIKRLLNKSMAQTMKLWAQMVSSIK